MKTRRLVLIAVAALGVLLVLAIGAAFVPRVQTWAVQRALRNERTMEISIGRVAAGLHHVDLTGVRVARDGAVLTLPSAEADLSLYAAYRRRVELKRLVARGWTLDLSHYHPRPISPATGSMSARATEFSLVPAAYAEAPSPAVAAGSEVFSGIFQYLRLPIDLSLEGVDLDGQIILPLVPERPRASAHVTITGGGMAANRAGKFDYVAVVTFEGAGVAVRQVTFRGTLGVVMDSPRTINRLVAATAAEADGPQFPDGVKLSFDLSASRSANGEGYAMSISSGPKQLAAVETTFPAGASHLSGNWRLDMRDRDVEPFAFGHALPRFEAVGEGSVDTDTSFAELHASGRLNTTVNHLEVIDPQLSVLGRVHLTADFDVAQRDAATRVDRLSLTLEDENPVASVQALQAFEFNFKTGELNVADPARDLLGVSFQGLPQAWIAPLLAGQGISLSGADVTGQLTASARNGGFTLRTNQPLMAAKLTMGQGDGHKWIDALGVSLTVSADYAPQGWQVEVGPLVFQSNGAPVLSIEGKVGRLAGAGQALKLTGKWSGQLPSLLAQPAVMGVKALTAGDTQGDFVASLGDRQELQFRAAFSHLSAGPTALPSLSADVRLDREADGKVTFSVPLSFERDGRKSDLALNGTATTGPGRVTLDARLTSEFLAVEDAQLLTAPFSTRPGKISTAAKPVATQVPFWEGVTGQVALALKKVSYAGKYQVTDVNGIVRIDPALVKLVSAKAGFDSDSALTVDGGVAFRAESAEPYVLDATVALNNFDTAPAFRAIDPTKPPTVEARVNLTSRLSATGDSLEELAERAHGDCVLTSKGGIFRGFAADLSDRIQKSQSRLTAIASFLGVVADDYVNKAKILAEIARTLSEIPFDQMSMTVTRDAALNLQLKDFSLIAPEVRIVGEGTVRAVEGVPVLAQPMALQLNIGARGKLGDLVKRAGLLESRVDNLGYSAFSVPLKIGGTLTNPDTNEVRTALLNSALERSGLLDSILGK